MFEIFIFSKNSILTKPQHFHEFFTPKNRQFSRELKVEFLDKKWRFRTVWLTKLFNFFQSVETSRRYEKLGSLVQAISATQDLNAFVKTLNIPESMTVSKHSFAPPNPADPAAVRFIQNPDSSTFFLFTYTNNYSPLLRGSNFGFSASNRFFPGQQYLPPATWKINVYPF